MSFGSVAQPAITSAFSTFSKTSAFGSLPTPSSTTTTSAFSNHSVHYPTQDHLPRDAINLLPPGQDSRSDRRPDDARDGQGHHGLFGREARRGGALEPAAQPPVPPLYTAQTPQEGAPGEAGEGVSRHAAAAPASIPRVLDSRTARHNTDNDNDNDDASNADYDHNNREDEDEDEEEGEEGEEYAFDNDDDVHDEEEEGEYGSGDDGSNGEEMEEAGEDDEEGYGSEQDCSSGNNHDNDDREGSYGSEGEEEEEEEGDHCDDDGDDAERDEGSGRGGEELHHPHPHPHDHGETQEEEEERKGKDGAAAVPVPAFTPGSSSSLPAFPSVSASLSSPFGAGATAGKPAAGAFVSSAFAPTRSPFAASSFSAAAATTPATAAAPLGKGSALASAPVVPELRPPASAFSSAPPPAAPTTVAVTASHTVPSNSVDTEATGLPSGDARDPDLQSFPLFVPLRRTVPEALLLRGPGGAGKRPRDPSDGDGGGALEEERLARHYRLVVPRSAEYDSLCAL